MRAMPGTTEHHAPHAAPHAPRAFTPPPPEASAAWNWRVLRAGTFRLDGGSMFGLVPRAVWSRAVTPDERGRIAVQHNCLLLERADAPGRPGAGPPGSSGTDAPAEWDARRALVEVGTGDKLDARNRDIFDLGDRSVLDALRECGVAPESIDAVVVTHLHFDHAGGLTRLCRAGETPDWTGPASTFGAPRGEHGVRRAFPGARVYVQAREWDDALHNRSVMTRTYFRDHLEPIGPQVRLVDSPRPFPPGYTPGREELPGSPVERRETPILPGVSVFLAPGHTWGQQAVKFRAADGSTVVFTPDVLPTVQHVGAAYSLGYDVEPYTSMVTRRWLLDEAARAGWLLVLDHEPGEPVFRVRENGKGWYELVPA